MIKNCSCSVYLGKKGAQLRVVSEEEEVPPIYQKGFHVDTDKLSEIRQNKCISKIEGSFIVRGRTNFPEMEVSEESD